MPVRPSPETSDEACWMTDTAIVPARSTGWTDVESGVCRLLTPLSNRSTAMLAFLTDAEMSSALPLAGAGAASTRLESAALSRIETNLIM